MSIALIEYIKAFFVHSAIPVEALFRNRDIRDLYGAYLLEGADIAQLVEFPGRIATVTTLEERDETRTVIWDLLAQEEDAP